MKSWCCVDSSNGLKFVATYKICYAEETSVMLPKEPKIQNYYWISLYQTFVSRCLIQGSIIALNFNLNKHLGTLPQFQYYVRIAMNKPTDVDSMYFDKHIHM